MKKNFIVFHFMGTIYILIEFWYHMIQQLFIYNFSLDALRLEGKSNLYMFCISGISALLIGLLNELKRDIKIFYQCMIGCILITTLEYFSGVILNIELGYNFWDYSDLPLNLNGQICIWFSFIWFMLIPCAIAVDDWYRHSYNLIGQIKLNYVKLFKFQ